MIQYTTEQAVIDLLNAGRDYDTVNTPSVKPFIDTAGVVIARMISCAAAKAIAHTSDEKEIIQRWLAAAMYAAADKPYASNSTEGASASYMQSSGTGWDQTTYGQQAQRLDYSNCLWNVDKQQVAGMVWLGKPASQQVPYEDRS